jgi:hypothetical protein
MDRIEKHRQDRPRSGFANEGEVSERDRALLPTPQGREPGTHNEAPSLADEEIADKTIGARPLSEVTDQRDASGDEETVDGLNAIEESVRHAAEDTAEPADDIASDDIPVFDRADLPPRI